MIILLFSLIVTARDRIQHNLSYQGTFLSSFCIWFDEHIKKCLLKYAFAAIHKAIKQTYLEYLGNVIQPTFILKEDWRPHTKVS